MSKKILGICGDSFATADSINNPSRANGKHFSEILGKMLDCEVITFARGGASNTCIRLQMDEIIKYNPTHVIVMTTSQDRIEIPIDDLSVVKLFDKWSATKFNPSNGIYNIKYEGFDTESFEQHENFKKVKPAFHSNNLQSLMAGYDGKNMIIRDAFNTLLGEEISTAIKYYFQYLYDPTYKLLLDTWIISDGIKNFIQKGVSFNLITPQINPNYFEFCKENVITMEDKLNPWTYYKPNEVCHNNFHISDEDSIVLAKLWYQKISNIFDKSNNGKLI